MLRIVMDSAGDIPEEWIDEYDINVIPINIQIKDQTYLQGVELNNNGFYQAVELTRQVPKTSQPTPQQFIDFYRSIAKLGDTILSLHVTAKLSGTFESAIMAARELVGKYQIIPFDSGAGSVAVGFMCREARLLELSGASIQAILNRMEFIRKNMRIVFTMDNLEYARLSGRVKALQAALVSILDVKPIVVLRDGVILMAEKVRTRHKALDRILDTIRSQVGDRLVNVAVVHARDPESGRSVLEKVRQKLNIAEVVFSELSISLAANLGPGTVGIIAYPIEEGG